MTNEPREELKRLQPVMILPKGECSPDDLKLLRENGICAIEAEHPDAVRFMEPPPEGYSAQEKAAIALCRYVINHGKYDVTFERLSLVDMFAKYLIEGTPLAASHVKPTEKVKGAQ